MQKNRIIVVSVVIAAVAYALFLATRDEPAQPKPVQPQQIEIKMPPPAYDEHGKG